MTDRTSSPRSTPWIAIALVAVALAAIGGWLAARHFSDPAASLSTADRRAIESVMHDYLLAHPEVIPEAMEELHRRENAKQLAGIREEVETPYAGAVLGNPRGSVTLVEFSDFACGYCRRSVADVEALLESHPDLRIVVRELPILSEESGDAARMALAAAEQGKYAAFYKAMFAAGRPGPDTIRAAARSAGLDLAKAHAAVRSPRIKAEIDRNLDFARQLGFSGTPSWIAGDALIPGAVGVDELAKAIKESKG